MILGKGLEAAVSDLPTCAWEYAYRSPSLPQPHCSRMILGCHGRPSDVGTKMPMGKGGHHGRLKVSETSNSERTALTSA